MKSGMEQSTWTLVTYCNETTDAPETIPAYSHCKCVHELLLSQNHPRLKSPPSSSYRVPDHRGVQSQPRTTAAYSQKLKRTVFLTVFNHLLILSVFTRKRRGCLFSPMLVKNSDNQPEEGFTFRQTLNSIKYEHFHHHFQGLEYATA